MLKALPPTVKPLISRKYQLVQIMPRSASKGRALRHLVESWGLIMDQVMAFGDDVNDLDMLAMSGIGVAMGDAEPEVLAENLNRIGGDACDRFLRERTFLMAKVGRERWDYHRNVLRVYRTRRGAATDRERGR